MKNIANSYHKIIALIGVALMAAGITTTSRPDSVYVGDAGDNTVKPYRSGDARLPDAFTGPLSRVKS